MVIKFVTNAWDCCVTSAMYFIPASLYSVFVYCCTLDLILLPALLWDLPVLLLIVLPSWFTSSCFTSSCLTPYRSTSYGFTSSWLASYCLHSSCLTASCVTSYCCNLTLCSWTPSSVCVAFSMWLTTYSVMCSIMLLSLLCKLCFAFYTFYEDRNKSRSALNMFITIMFNCMVVMLC